MKKDYLIFAGVAVTLVIIYLYLQKQSANAAAYANEPGLETQPGIGATASNAFSGALGSIISSAGSSLSGLISTGIAGIGNGFSSQSSDGSNEPGLDGQDSTPDIDDDDDDDDDLTSSGTDYGGSFSGVDYFSGSDDFDD